MVLDVGLVSHGARVFDMAGLTFEKASGIKLQLAMEDVAVDLTARPQVQYMGEDVTVDDAGQIDFIGYKIAVYDRIGLNPEFAARDAPLDFSRYDDIIVGYHGAAYRDAFIDMENLLSHSLPPDAHPSCVLVSFSDQTLEI